MRKLSIFIITSGIGWIIDLMIFSFCVHFFKIPVVASNFISAGIAVILVFAYSTKNIFQNAGQNASIKLVIYIFYQVLSIFIFSIIMEYTSFILAQFSSMYNIRQIAAKIIITPITLLTNFIVMKYLVEKIDLKKFGGKSECR